MVFLPSFSNVSIAYRGGGWEGKQGGIGGGKTPQLGHSMNSHDAHMVANATLLDHGVNPRPPLIWHPPLVPLFQW